MQNNDKNNLKTVNPIQFAIQRWASFDLITNPISKCIKCQIIHSFYSSKWFDPQTFINVSVLSFSASIIKMKCELIAFFSLYRRQNFQMMLVFFSKSRYSIELRRRSIQKSNGHIDQFSLVEPLKIDR